MSRSSGYDRAITIFSPEGKLYQVEYAFKAVKCSGLTSLCLKGSDSVVCVTQKKVPDKMMVGSSITNLHNITTNIGCMMTGLVADSRAYVSQARQEASKFQDSNGYEMPVHFLAHRMASINQVNTQQAGMRPAGVIAMFFSIDDESGPALHKVDPSGRTCGYKGCAAGVKEQEATNALEKVVKRQPDGFVDKKKTLRDALSTLQMVLGIDFKPADVEVGIVSKDQPRFTRLEENEIDALLTAIAEEG